MTLAMDKSYFPTVLIVDDVPANLAVLHDCLDESGFKVLVADNGKDALQHATKEQPDVILLDAVMPGMNGFEVCRQLKAEILTRQIPVIFMTGLTESEHVLAAFNSGGVDYVTKPIRPIEVVARIRAHMKSSQMINQSQSVLDLSGQAAIAVNVESWMIVWQTPLAGSLIASYFEGNEQPGSSSLPFELMSWLRVITAKDYSVEPQFVMSKNESKLFLKVSKLEGEEKQLLISFREESIGLQLQILINIFGLTQKEAEVLYWAMQGKTNKDVADILGGSPRTVNKHMEHIFEKLGVETRTAAAALARRKLEDARVSRILCK
jgi:DNA-binding NarL/FixJ family response regulator